MSVRTLPLVALIRAAERRGELIELLLRDRIELVIVAAAAIDGQAQERLADRGDEPFQFLLAGKRPHGGRAVVVRRQIVGPSARNPLAMTASGSSGSQHVAGNLPADELVVRHVRVERLDHEVAVLPGVGPKLVALEALALAVANDVEPVPGPALAVVRRVEQPIDQPLVGAGSRVVRQTPRPRAASAAGRSGRTTGGGSACAGRPRATGAVPLSSTGAG